MRAPLGSCMHAHKLHTTACCHRLAEPSRLALRPCQQSHLLQRAPGGPPDAPLTHPSRTKTCDCTTPVQTPILLATRLPEFSLGALLRRPRALPVVLRPVQPLAALAAVAHHPAGAAQPQLPVPAAGLAAHSANRGLPPAGQLHQGLHSPSARSSLLDAGAVAAADAPHGPHCSCGCR